MFAQRVVGKCVIRVCVSRWSLCHVDGGVTMIMVDSRSTFVGVIGHLNHFYTGVCIARGWSVFNIQAAIKDGERYTQEIL